MRMEPPVSVPSAANAIPVATATADPPDEPPGIRVVSHGFRHGPKCGFSVVTPEGDLMHVGLADDQSAGRLESCDNRWHRDFGTWSLKKSDPDVVRMPAVSNRSFTAIGTLSKGSAGSACGCRLALHRSRVLPAAIVSCFHASEFGTHRDERVQHGIESV